MKSPLSKSINFPKPTENGVLSFVKSRPADNKPASILLPLNPGEAVSIIPILFPFSRIKSPIFFALFSGRK